MSDGFRIFTVAENFSRLFVKEYIIASNPVNYFKIY